MKKRITAIILTYGSRNNFLNQTLQSVLDQNQYIDDVIIIDNASNPTPKIQIHTKTPVKLISLAKNTGSAGGFYRGLCEVLESNSEYFLLLDDDNALMPNCLHELLTNAPQDTEIRVCHRPQRPEFTKFINRLLVFPQTSHSFMGFQALPFSSKLWKNHDSVHFGYGGALIPKSVLHKNILPDPSLFLYHDDSEWAFRLLKHGYSFNLSNNACICDLESPWGGLAETGGSPLFSHRSPAFKLWYSIRNRTYLDAKRGFDLNLLFVNFIIWMIALNIKTLISEKNLWHFFRISTVCLDAFQNGITKFRSSDSISRNI